MITRPKTATVKITRQTVIGGEVRSVGDVVSDLPYAFAAELVANGKAAFHADAAGTKDEQDADPIPDIPATRPRGRPRGS